MQETKEAPTARVRTRVKPLVGAATEAAERHAGAVADRVVANLGTGSPVAGVAQTKIRRLTTTSQSLGDTGTVGKAKAVVGKSNYVNIKKELTKAQAAAPAAQAKHLNRILRLIQAWMKQNEAGTSKGNLARKAKLEALRTEVTAALAAPPARPAAAAPMTALAPAAAHSARSAPAPARPKTAAPAGAKGKAAKPAGAPARPKTPTPAKAMAPAAGTGWKAAKPTAPTPAPPAPDVFSRISIALDDIIGIGDDGRFDTKQLDDYTAADMPPLPAVPAKAKPAVSTPAVAPAPAPATAWVAFPAPAKRGAPTPAAAPTPALAPTPAIATPAAVLATPAPAPAPAAVPAAAPVVAPPVADPARVQHLADELAAFAMCIDGEPSVAMRVMFLGTVRDDLDELEPLLTDPGLKKTHKAVVDLSRALLANLPLWEEQAEYLRDLKGGQDKFAFLTGLGVKAIADAVSLAAAAATPGTAFPGGLGMGPLALQLMRDRKITDAEMAAIKLYTAPEYKYMTVGMEKRAAQFRPKDADNPAGDPGALGWLKGAIGGLEDEAEVGAANAPRSAKQMNINPKTGKAWTPEQLKKKGRHRNDEVLGAALQPGEFGPLSPADTAADEGQRHTKMAMAGLEKLEKVSGIETYRGMSLPKVAFERDYKEGGSWQTKALVSTSRRDVKAIQFVRIAKGEVKFLIKFKVEDGRDVDVISVNQGEYEVLLLPGATGTITKIEPEAPPRNYKIVHIQQDP